MILDALTQQFASAQLVQENSFPWPSQQAAYAPQIKVLAAVWKKGSATVETSGDIGLVFRPLLHSKSPFHR